MDIGRSFSYVFQDPRWLTKVLIGAVFYLLTSILIGIPFVLGYMLEIMRNVHRGEPMPLPEWSNLGALFSDGFKLFLGYLVYYIPVIILICCAAGGLSIGADSRGNPSGVGLAVAIPAYCLLFVYAIAFAIMMPALAIQYARTGVVGSMFQFREVIAIVRRVPGPYAIVVLLTFLLLPNLASLGLILCIVGVFLAYAYTTMVSGHLYGQLWQQVDQGPAMAPRYA
jgi:hypothetical protein